MATGAPSPLASSREKINGSKLSRLIIDGGTTVLRNIFDHYHPPVNLASDLNSHYSVLTNLWRKRVLNIHQWNKLFPPGGGVPDSRTFDITLLFLLLTTICIGLSPPPSGWHTKPPPSDNSLEANLARVKFFRNELYGHVTSTGVDATSFSSFWQEISITLHSLGLDQAEIDRLKAEQGGEEDYLDALIDWADSEQDIKTWLTNIRHTQLEIITTLEDGALNLEELRHAQYALSKTQDLADEAVDVELKRHQQLGAAHHKSVSHLQGECESQTKTSQAGDKIRESTQEVKPDEVLKTLVKSEFQGDIEYHAKKFQEGTRDWIFKSIEKWLDDQSLPHRAMVISGNPGMGKSVISAVVSQRMKQAGMLAGSHFCQHNNSRYRDPRLMLQSLARHLCQAMPNYKDALVEQLSRNTVDEDLKKMSVEELFALLFKEPLSTVQDPGRNTLIIIDGLDESEYQGRNELLHVISNHFSMLPVWIRILITTRPERSITEALRHLEPIELKQKCKENLNDIQTLFENQLSNKIGEEHKDIILKELVEKSEGLFIYAFFIVDYIQKNVSFLTPDQLQRVLPSGISSFYLSYFKRLENELCKELDTDEESFLRFLCALTASREPLPVEFIAKILYPGEKSLTAQRKVNRAISSISTLLPVREGRIHFFHKSIKDWLRASFPYEKHDFTVDEKEGHNVLSDLCAPELDSIKRKEAHGKQFTNTERYALIHTFQHMREADSDHQRIDGSGTISGTSNQESATDGRSASFAGRPLRVTLVGDEWGSSKGGLSTLNRELAKNLARQPGVEVTILLPHYSEREKKEANDCRVSLATPEPMNGFDSIRALSFTREDHGIDVVIGHGQKLGAPAQVIAKQRKCRRVHMVHTASEELAMFKEGETALPEGEENHRTEMHLCKEADVVLAIGPKLKEAVSANLRCYGRDEHVIDITPGIFSEFANLEQASQEREQFRILVFGRGNLEDFELKGYDIAAEAVAGLKDEDYLLQFVGAPKGKEEEVKNRLLKCGIPRTQLTVRRFAESRNEIKELLWTVDLAIMPSRTEGFGLTALEALSAGLPILVSNNSGFGQAIHKVEFGSASVVCSDDPREWGKAIRRVRQKLRKLRLKEACSLRKSYDKEYKWETQCEKLVDRMRQILK